MSPIKQVLTECLEPVMAWRSKELNPETGKRPMVWTSRKALDDEVYWLDCGACDNCLKKKQNEWMIRQVHEAQIAPMCTSFALTLTYDEPAMEAKELPCSLDYRDVQLFNKALRRISPFRFYCAGEYGTQYERPHFHLNIFGFDMPEMYEVAASQQGHKQYMCDKITELWGKGRVTISYFTPQSARYVAKYAAKLERDLDKAKRTFVEPKTGEIFENVAYDPEKVNSNRFVSHMGVRCPYTGEFYDRKSEFKRMSNRPGIGYPWLEKFWKDVFRRWPAGTPEHEKKGQNCPVPKVVIGDCEYGVPKYYVDKLKDFDEELHIAIVEDRQNACRGKMPADYKTVEYQKAFNENAIRSSQARKHIMNIKYGRDDTI